MPDKKEIVSAFQQHEDNHSFFFKLFFKKYDVSDIFHLLTLKASRKPPLSAMFSAKVLFPFTLAE